MPVASTAWVGKRAIVSGATSGIGEALAVELARHRARLVLTGRSLAGLDRVAGRCVELGADVETVAGDLTSADVQHALVSKAEDAYGGLDLLVNNAGISMNARFQDLDEEVLREIFEINFFAAASLTRLAIPLLVATHGRIVVISSVTGLVATPTRSAYAASKHALHGLFDALRVELRASGVTVTLVCPGLVRSEIRRRALLADGRPQGRDDAEGRRLMDPETVARRTLSATANGKRRLLLGKETRMARILSVVAPTRLDALLERMGR